MCFHLHSKFQLWLSLRFVISCKFCKYHIAQNIDSIWIRKWMQLIKLWTHEILSNKALFLYWCICIRFKSEFSNSNHFLKSIAILSHLKILRERKNALRFFSLLMIYCHWILINHWWNLRANNRCLLLYSEYYLLDWVYIYQVS